MAVRFSPVNNPTNIPTGSGVSAKVESEYERILAIAKAEGCKPPPRDGKGTEKRGHERFLRDLAAAGTDSPAGGRASAPALATDGEGEAGPSRVEIAAGNVGAVIGLIAFVLTLVAILVAAWVAALNRGDFFLGVAWTIGVAVLGAFAVISFAGQMGDDLFGDNEELPPGPPPLDMKQ